ncbi:hypothetical protein P3S68_016312 [Capsicum galapagoense]
MARQFVVLALVFVVVVAGLTNATADSISITPSASSPIADYDSDISPPAPASEASSPSGAPTSSSISAAPAGSPSAANGPTAAGPGVSVVAADDYY